MRIAVVNLEDMSIATIYPGDTPNQKGYGGDWGNPQITKHVAIPVEIESDMLIAEEVEGEIVISENMELKRNMKLAMLRDVRRQKMQEVDIMVNDLSVGDRVDTTAVREYRTALKEITEDYKYANDDMRGKAALDAFADDMSDFVWPTKP